MGRPALGGVQLPAQGGNDRRSALKELNHLRHPIRRLAPRLNDEDGQTIIEYGLLLGGVSIVLIGLLMSVGLTDGFTTLVENIAAQLT
jgi:Flp pilus assembly pilin Flp